MFSVTSIFLSFQLIALSRAELKLFDSAMNLSCRSNSIFATQKCTDQVFAQIFNHPSLDRGYKGPFLPKDTNYKQIRQVTTNTVSSWLTPLVQDMRVVRLSGKLLDPLADVIGGDVTRLGRLVVLSSLPLHPLFIVDLMIYPSHAASLNRFGFKTNNSSNTAVLILTPEDYDR